MFTVKQIPLRGLMAALALCLGLASLNTQAAFIDFDDIEAIPAEPFDGCFCGHILSNEYESQGLLFTGTDNWLIGGPLPDGTNQNIVVGFNTISFAFVGTLPNFLSFNINSPFQAEASFVEVYGESGLLFTYVTSGWTGLEETSTPYIPDELVSIYSADAIKNVVIMSLFNEATGPSIDNLTFTKKTVPEPALLWLFATAFTGVLWRRFTSKKA